MQQVLEYLEMAWFVVLVITIAFACEYMDSALGMGYGTTLTPVLILLGFEPAEIVPAILVSEFITGLTSAGFHVAFKNIKLRSTSSQVVVARVIPALARGGDLPRAEMQGQVRSLKRFFHEMTLDTKIVMILSLLGVLGAVLAALISTVHAASRLARFIIKLYIGLMVLSMGIIILVFRNRKFAFSFKKITLVGALAGFNKAISGGGYGPITVSGQIMSGVDGRKAVASTSVSESLACLAGVITYITMNLYLHQDLGNFSIAPSLIIGSVLSAPIAAFTTKKMDPGKFKSCIGIATMLLGAFSLIRTVHGLTW
ncbi:TSUP family transporter [Candidatus Bathyarchaeota archaeon]|nr:TSUP family transporter [Candidatus Bathyarchaeota archaeon]